MKITFQGNPDMIEQFHQLQRDKLARLFSFEEQWHGDQLEVQVEQKTFIHHRKTRVAGPMYERRQELIEQMTNDTPLRLQREPQNEYDENAVAIYAEINEEWHKIGYVHAHIAKRVGPLMDQGEPVEIHLNSIEIEDTGPSEPWEEAFCWLGAKITLVYEDIMTVDYIRWEKCEEDHS